MFRQLVLAAFVSTGIMGATTAISAAEPVFVSRESDWGREHFQVLVRHHGHWDVHGTYRDRDDARRVARNLERRGFDARIERVHR